MIVVDFGILCLLFGALIYFVVWFVSVGPMSWRKAKQERRAKAMKEVEYALRDHDAVRLKRVIAFEGDNFKKQELEYLQERQDDFVLEEHTKRKGF